MARNNLPQRIATAVAVVAILLPGFLYLPKAFGTGLIAAFVLAAGWEWSAFPLWQATWARVVFVAALALGMLAALVTVPEQVAPASVAAVSMPWWFAAFLLVLVFPVRIGRAVTAMAGFMVLLPAWVSLVALLNTAVAGRKLLLLSLALVWGADVGAYFAGRSFGRVKLAPRVSPGKTWEGAIGGTFCATVIAEAGARFLGHQPWSGLALGLSVGALSIVGDLTVSVFKRAAGLKDSGNLFPGHGGVLDRVDSVTAAAPLFLLEAGWLGWLGR